MAQRKHYGREVILARKLAYMKRRQKELRSMWLDFDVKINAVSHEIHKLEQVRQQT